MWRDKIIDAKKERNITTKMMSEKVRLPEQTITRILSGKTATPRIDTVLDLGAAVGLSPWELFSETTSVLGDKSLAALQDELDHVKAALYDLQSEFASLSKENTGLKLKNVTLQAENNLLKTKLEHKEEIIALHNFYRPFIDEIVNNVKAVMPPKEI